MSDSEKPLFFDITVRLAEVEMVFSIDALAFEGDLPASIFNVRLTEGDIGDWKARSNAATGNPYKELAANLMKHGVQIELCQMTAKILEWGNEALLPGIKVTTGTMARTT